MLSIVSTPIGNLEDITFRAVRTLQEADIIACEDTRTSGVLLRHYEISKPLISFHAHSGDVKVDKIIALLKEGKHVALISDAGTPGISDPAYILVKRAVEENITVVPIPGASAVLSALVGSGMHMHDFRFIGFLPVKKGRETMFKSLKDKDYTVVIYESVHRIIRTLSDFEKYFGPDYPIVVGRELTKKFEEFKHGTVRECREYFEKQNCKGEFVIVF
ncbi:MAG: 16S rRNA (cytidine(1402)-2'-O)-methyltransferase [Candidatus Gracilibacteria bacterium]|nr:16S rRNA (cytidine(1402)-2'-O)-methyltransferase [Candidatus Gracilibacteria bacterium]